MRTGLLRAVGLKMAILSFTLSEEGVAVFHDALSCLVKFSEDVCLEAFKDKACHRPKSTL